MADVVWSGNLNTNSASFKTYEAVIDDSDTSTEILPLVPGKEISFAIKSSVDTYTVNVFLYLEDTNNASAIAYQFLSAAGTTSDLDTIKSSVGPISGIRFVAETATASNDATIQVLQY